MVESKSLLMAEKITFVLNEVNIAILFEISNPAIYESCPQLGRCRRARVAAAQLVNRRPLLSRAALSFYSAEIVNGWAIGRPSAAAVCGRSRPKEKRTE